MLDFPEEDRLPDILGLKKGDELGDLGRTDPGEGLGFALERFLGGTPDTGDDTVIAFPPGIGDRLPGELPGARDYSEALSHESAVFLTIPRLDARTKARSSSRSSPDGIPEVIRSKAWAVFKSE